MTSPSLDPRPTDRAGLEPPTPEPAARVPRSPEPASTSAPTPAADLPPLRIAHLWPSLLNVAGDGGNVTAVEARSRWRGLATETVGYEAGDPVPDLSAFDIVFVQGGQDVEMTLVAADLPRIAGALRDAADAGVVMLPVCAGLQLLGHAYIPGAGSALEGAHVLDLETRGGSQRFMQHAACEVTIDSETDTVVGFENHSGVTELGPGAVPFGRVVAGAGNNGRDGNEGARRDNVFATYLHGPVLPKNPWLADMLVRIALSRRTGARVHLAPLDDALERRNHDVALEKALRNRGQRTALTPARLHRKAS
jgi:CobQ-like glutamine amidotransferase family enzyme